MYKLTVYLNEKMLYLTYCGSNRRNLCLGGDTYVSILKKTHNYGAKYIVEEVNTTAPCEGEDVLTQLVQLTFRIDLSVPTYTVSVNPFVYESFAQEQVRYSSANNPSEPNVKHLDVYLTLLNARKLDFDDFLVKVIELTNLNLQPLELESYLTAYLLRN